MGPSVGWGMKFLDCLFVRRNWQQDRAGMDTLFGRFKSNNINVAVLFSRGHSLHSQKWLQRRLWAKARAVHARSYVDPEGERFCDLGPRFGI